MTPGEGSTRDRLLDAALELFARQGYAATSVAEIQEAAGLSPGSGALYKHFQSKNALLIDATQHDRTRPADIREALRKGATRIWDVIETNADLLRVMFREPEAIEDFADELWTAVTFTAYERMGEALSGAKAAGSSHVEDPEATSAVLLSALAYLPIVRILTGRTPGNIEADRFRDAWLRLAEGVFNGAPPT
jgi:AcrR family transcriptional regulator